MITKTMSLRIFNKEELSQYGGKRGRPAFIACQGKVYDVTDSFLWKKGEHQVLHHAGCDLTVALVEAPHGTDLLGKFLEVGILFSDPLQDKGSHQDTS
jgi:predicted heme/steroid binding protein